MREWVMKEKNNPISSIEWKNVKSLLIVDRSARGARGKTHTHTHTDSGDRKKRMWNLKCEWFSRSLLLSVLSGEREAACIAPMQLERTITKKFYRLPKVNSGNKPSMYRSVLMQEMGEIFFPVEMWLVEEKSCHMLTRNPEPRVESGNLCLVSSLLYSMWGQRGWRESFLDWNTGMVQFKW